jgi:hypothetical protein
MDEEKPVADRNSLLSTRGTFRELAETHEVRSTMQKRVDSGLETRKSRFT